MSVFFIIPFWYFSYSARVCFFLLTDIEHIHDLYNGKQTNKQNKRIEHRKKNSSPSSKMIKKKKRLVGCCAYIYTMVCVYLEHNCNIHLEHAQQQQQQRSYINCPIDPKQQPTTVKMLKSFRYIERK